MFPYPVQIKSLFPVAGGDEVLVSYIVWFFLLYVFMPFVRYVVGVKHWRYSTVFMLSLSLWLFLANFRRIWVGVIIWLTLLVVALSTGIAMYKYLVTKRIHYFVKVSLVIINMLFGLAIVVWGVYFASGVSLLSTQNVVVSLMLLFSSLYEFVVLFSRKGWLEFFRRGGVTLMVAILWGIAPAMGYGFGVLFKVHLLILLIAVLLLGSVLAGWKNITILEFFRFRRIVKESD